ncbi:MFS transporter [Adlercreutzia murintestinalis]|uniref:MFS transporter n=1 Tax=Adlercreutzia murintestinalis TaxID=2941325 RepID=UPI0032E4C9C9
MAMSVGYYMLMVVMTSYTMATYGASEAVAAFTASIFIIGTLIARLASGAFMERIGRKRLALIGAALTIVLNGAYLMGSTLELLMTVRFLHGFFYGVFSTAMATLVTSIIPHERKGEGIGYYMLSVTMAAALGPFLGIFISARFDFCVLFILSMVCAGATLLCALFMRAVPVPDRPCANTDALADDMADASVLDAPELEGEYERLSAAGDVSAPAVRSRLLDRLIEVRALPIAGVAGLIFFGYSALLTFLQPFASQIDLTRAASVFFIVYAIAMFVTRPFTGRAFDRRGPRPIMIPAFISFVVGMVVLSAANNDWALLASALLLGFGVGTIQSCGLAMAVRQTTDARLSLANATFYILLDTGVGIGPLLLGAVVPLIGYRCMYLALAGVGLCALVLFLVITRRRCA